VSHANRPFVTQIYTILTGTTYDGKTIEGEDEIIIVPQKE